MRCISVKRFSTHVFRPAVSCVILVMDSPLSFTVEQQTWHTTFSSRLVLMEACTRVNITHISLRTINIKAVFGHPDHTGLHDIYFFTSISFLSSIAGPLRERSLPAFVSRIFIIKTWRRDQVVLMRQLRCRKSPLDLPIYANGCSYNMKTTSMLRKWTPSWCSHLRTKIRGNRRDAGDGKEVGWGGVGWEVGEESVRQQRVFNASSIL